MRKRIILAGVLFLIFCMAELPANAKGEVITAEEEMLDEYARFYGDIFEENLEEAGIEDFFEFAPELDAEEIIKQLNSGNLNLSAKQVLKYLLKMLLGEVYSGARLIAIVLALSVLSSYLGGLKSGFGGESVAKCAFYMCYIIIAGIASTAFYDIALCAGRAIENIGFFMRVIVPVMITLLMTSGAVISASTLEPAFLSIAEIAVWVIETVFIPGVMLSTALNIVNGISDRFKTDRMVKLLNNSVKWGLTIMLTIFVSLAGLKSIAASGADGLTVKLSKFATSNLIPMVGGILAESVETVMSCSVVIKNSVGVLGIICLIVVALGPVMKIAAMLILFRITAAVAEPVSEERIVVCISRLADSVSVLFSMLTAVVIMFIMVVTIIINSGNTAVMLGR